MRNKYAGICDYCKQSVAVGAGHFEKQRSGDRQWIVRHATCTIERREIIARASEDALDAKS